MVAQSSNLGTRFRSGVKVDQGYLSCMVAMCEKQLLYNYSA